MLVDQIPWPRVSYELLASLAQRGTPALGKGITTGDNFFDDVRRQVDIRHYARILSTVLMFVALVHHIYSIG